MEKIILIVDDEKDICEVLDISLTDIGYKVYTAGNGEEALQVYRDIRPPIVLTDIRMPGMDGIDLLKRIKQENRDTEVIMITGHGDLDLAIKSLKLEATDFITKPLNFDVLEIALKRAHERISMRQEITFMPGCQVSSNSSQCGLSLGEAWRRILKRTDLESAISS